MTYLAENLASKGYVVAAVGHTDSTFDNVGRILEHARQPC